MPREIEAKYAVGSFAAVRRRLSRLGAVFEGTCVESDRFFDTPEGRLRGHDSALRVRSRRRVRKGAAPTPDRALLTFKGPKAPNARLKIRPEVQTLLDDPDAAAAIFAELGLRVVARVQKRRSSYRLGRVRVELDELEGIGRFVEVEGPTEKAVLAAVKKLKLLGEPITTSYLAMTLAAENAK